MRKWLEDLLKTLAYILVIGVIIGVGIHTLEDTKVLVMKCGQNCPGLMNASCQEHCDLLNSGQVDGKEKWNWVDKYLGWIIFIIVLAGVLAFLMYWQPFVYGGGLK